eukprot:CCRYP_002069-RA/>CCRYP_002069-RA protein AED:0.45 eAED:0.45 QI:0/-1/0/1/-1/0/1/0/115
MESVLSGIEDADVYIDDIGAFFQDWDHRIKLLVTILRRLRENGFTINPLKCEWQFRRLIGSAIGLHPEVSSHGKRKSRLSCTWIAPAMPQNCECSLAVLIIIVICGLVVPIFSNP